MGLRPELIRLHFHYAFCTLKYIMKHKTCITLALGLSLLGSAYGKPFSLSSPDGKLKATVSDDGGSIRYSVALNGKEVIAPSIVGIRSDGVDWGKEGTLGAPEVRDVSEQYPFLGAKPVAVNRACTATVPPIPAARAGGTRSAGR